MTISAGAPREPLRLPANRPAHFYRGGAAITALRGTEATGRAGHPDAAPDEEAYAPEDWVASTTNLFGRAPAGLTRLPDGRWLRDAVEADPPGWLGPDHVARFGPTPALLVKLLDAGQRLPVHYHPDDAFAREHFDAHFGKTEAWVVVGTEGDRPTVHAGFRHPVGADTVRNWMHGRDTGGMLDALNTVEVAPGDTVHVPAGLPHAIGEGVFVVELQQPTDLSLMLEWRHFLGDPVRARLGLDVDTALRALDTAAWDTDRVNTLIRRGTGVHGPGRESVLAPGAETFFRAERLHPVVPVTLDPSFAVLVVLTGTARLDTGHGGRHALAAGETWLVPHAAGELEVTGDATILSCRPPSAPRRP